MKNPIALCEDGITWFLTYCMILLSVPFLSTPFNEDFFSYKAEKKTMQQPHETITLHI